VHIDKTAVNIRTYLSGTTEGTLKSENACYHSVQNLLSSSLLSKNIQIKIHRNIILPVVLYGCETWSLTFRERHRLMMVENGLLRKIFGRKTDEVTVEWRILHSEKLYDQYCLPHNIRVIKSRRMIWVGHVARMRKEVPTKFWWGDLMERDHPEDLGVDGKIILK